MKLFLVFLGLATALFSTELFFTVLENDREKETRTLNRIAEGEKWWQSGSVLTLPENRLVYQGPVGNPEDFVNTDPELGYRLKPNLNALPGRLRRAGVSYYEVTYSTDPEGRRSTSSPRDQPHVAFFGDSFTFGHGLNEVDTLPMQYAKNMGGKVHVINYGVPGWGPQQILRTLELSQEMRGLQGEHLSKSFYFLLREHLPRLAGLRLESEGTPRYLIKDGKPQFSGHFPRQGAWAELCGYSAICTAARAKWRENSSRSLETGAQPAELVAVVKEIAAILLKRHQSGLTVITWASRDPLMTEVENSLKAAGLSVVSIDQAIPDFASHPEAYTIPFDGHPNALAIEKLGAFLAK